MTKEKRQFLVLKEHNKINLENPTVGIVIMDITALRLDLFSVKLVQKVTGVTKMIKESHQYLVLVVNTKMNWQSFFVGDVLMELIAQQQEPQVARDVHVDFFVVKI